MITNVLRLNLSFLAQDLVVFTWPHIKRITPHSITIVLTAVEADQLRRICLEFSY